MGTASSNEKKKSKKSISNKQSNNRENILKKFADEFKFNEELPILPNYTEEFSLDDQKIKLKCNVIKKDRNQKNKKITIVILNDCNIEKTRNYIKEHYRFKKYRNCKNLVDKLILSRNDIDISKCQQLYHDLEDYNLYAEIVDAFNYQIFNENEIENIRNIFENINTNIEYEINQFIDLCFYLITEYVKFVLVKIVKFHQCQECGTKCLYILFCCDQKRVVEEYQPANDDLERGINIVENLLDRETLINSNEHETLVENPVTNIIYLNGKVNKNELELIEKNATGTVFYLINIPQLESLLEEIYKKNDVNKLNYKFLLISSGELCDNLIKFLSEDSNKIYNGIIDKVIISCEDKKKYLNKKYVDDVIDNPNLLGQYIKKIKPNSEYYKTFPIINYELYTKEYNQIHKQLAKYYGKISYSYKDAINLFKEFLFNEYQRPLKIDTNKIYKKKALLEALEVFSSNDKGREEVKIRKYTEQKNSYYQDFNYWLNSVDKTAISKIAYFVSSLMFALNNRATSVISKEPLYRGMNIDLSNLIKYYMNYIKDNNIISFSSFTSTSTNEKTAKSFIKKNKDNFGILFKINYNYNEKIWKYLAINISSISAFKNENERLFLPFTFYKIKNFEFNIENRLAKIELDCIFKKEILEEKLNEKNNVIYNKKENIMELDNEIIITEEKFLIDDNENKKYNEIELKIKIENNDINNTIYFLDNTEESEYLENGKRVYHNHDNLREMNETNTTLIINGKKESFKKSFIPTESGTYSIILILNCKLLNCAFMFCDCENITDVDLSKFKSENVTNTNFMFYHCKSLKSVNLKTFNTQNVTNMEFMFNGCSSLTSLNLSSFNTQNVTCMESMFSGCINLTEINLNFNTEKVTNMEGMFCRLSNLTSLNLSSFNTQNVTDMSFMFGESDGGCASLKSLDLSSFNTEKVTNMKYMFYGCSDLTLLNLSSFNTRNVTDMTGMFFNCFELESLDLKSFKTENVTSMRGMFASCKSLSSLDLRSFNTQKVSDMAGMFQNCKYLTEINLSSFDTQNVTTMHSMFKGCSSLKTLNVTSFNTQNVTNMYSMFMKCSFLTILDLSSFNTRNVNDMSFMFGDGQGGCSSLKTLDLSSFNTNNVTEMEGMFTNCSSLETLNITSFKTVNVTSMRGMFSDCKSLTSLDLRSFNTREVSNMEGMFQNCTSLTEINLSSFNTQNVTTMHSMFKGCSSLKTLDLSSFNTQNVTNMYSMFMKCSSLTTLDLSSFNTRNVNDMSFMFGDGQGGCSSLKTLDLSSFNTNNVTEMEGMFIKCSSLETLNITSFKTVNVTSMRAMFSDCKSLISLDLRSFNTREASDMLGMFQNCTSLTEINLSSFNTQNVTNMSYMFKGCSSLKTLNITSFNTQNVTAMGKMFTECSLLTTLNLSSFNTQNVTNMECMFLKCSSLTTLDLSSFNTKNVTNMFGMFCGCSSLISLDLSSFNTQNVTNMSFMFGDDNKGCNSLKALDLSSFNTKNVNNMQYMFCNCPSLTSLDLSSFNALNASTDGMFKYCRNLLSCNCSDKNIVEAFNNKNKIINGIIILNKY